MRNLLRKLPQAVIEEVRRNLAGLQSNEPLGHCIAHRIQ